MTKGGQRGIPAQHQDLARLVDKTYRNEKDDYNEYVYKSSLYLDLKSSILSGNLLGTAKRHLPQRGEAPKMNYYQTEKADVFSVRGSDDSEDLLMGATLIIQDSIRNIIEHPSIKLKEKQLSKFIRQNQREGKELILTAHSLGSYHINNIHAKFPEARVIGFGHAGFSISPKAEALYSFDKDPFYRPTGKSNHIVLNKPASAFLHNPFKEFHSTNNFYD